MPLLFATSSMKVWKPRITLAPPVSSARFRAAGLVQRLFVGAMASITTSARKPIRCSVTSSTSDASSTSPTSRPESR